MQIVPNLDVKGVASSACIKDTASAANLSTPPDDKHSMDKTGSSPLSGVAASARNDVSALPS